MKNHFMSELEKTAYVEMFTRTVLREVFKLVDIEKKELGSEIGDLVVCAVLSKYIKTMVTKSLMSANSKEAYSRMKFKIEDAVAEGFAAAFIGQESVTDGEPAASSDDYVCKVLKVNNNIKGNV